MEIHSNPKKENWEPLIGDVEFKDVDFKYPDGDEMVLENFNLDVPHGTNVAIVGETGAGKSIMLDAISILCAERAGASYISKGKEKAIIEGTFDLSQNQHAIDVLAEAGLETN